MALPELAARIRQQAGTGSARAWRRAGMVPAILHQPPHPPLLLIVKAYDLKRQALAKPNSVVLLNIQSPEDVQTVEARIQEVQRHPFRDYLLHLDFMAVAERPASSSTVS
jgi:large subunit ribosomal protein L25